MPSARHAATSPAPSPAAPRKHTAVLAEHVSLQGKRVADIGCGDGGLAKWMARQGATVLGIDCAAPLLAQARAGTPVPGATFQEGVAERLPLPDGALDVAIFFNSLHHVPADAMAMALAEARRALAAHGLLLVVEPIAEGENFELGRAVDDETAVRAAALARLREAEAAGGWQRVSEFAYDSLAVARSFEAWRDRHAHIAPERAAALAREETALRARFQTLGRAVPEAEGGGRAFLQPMRVTILRRTAAPA